VRSLAYHRPDSISTALDLKRSLPASRYLAGGTDLLVQMKNGTSEADALISLRGIADLKGISTRDGTTRIGALTPLADILRHERIVRDYSVLAQAIGHMASPQIRNAASLGGNLCNASPCANTPPALIVLGARALIEGPDGRREVPIEDFFIGPRLSCMRPDEILAAILLDPPRPGAAGVFLKMGRMHVDISLVNIAVLVEREDERLTRVRAATGAVAPVPLRLHAVEELLEGQVASPELLLRAQELVMGEIKPISDVRASADYRRRITGVLLRRALERLLGWSRAS